MNIRRLLISICATSLLAVFVSDTTIAANAKTVPVEQTQLKHFSHFLSVQTVPTSAMHPELIEQLRTRKAGSVKFWEAVSWCETNHDWNNGGYFSGGLGMAQSVWVNYGGKQFASRPPKATKEEQIIVGNRVSFLGYQTKNTFRTLDDKLNNRPFFRPAIGWRNSKNWGRGCINWETRKPLRERYTEEGMAEWKKTRPGYKAPSGKVSTQSLASDKTKRCPQWEAQLKARGLVPVKKFSYIMWRESRCQMKVIGWNYHPGKSHKDCQLAPAHIYKKCPAVKSYDSGLLQINSTWKTLTARVCGKKFGDLTPLLKADCNLKVAKALLDDGGMGHWSASSGSES
jgi:hypothetical protein